MNEMQTLVEELRAASDAYYNTGNTLMSDSEFDIKLNKLRQMEKETGIVLAGSPTVNVGFTVYNSLVKRRHQYRPMLSLDKVHSAEEIGKFTRKPTIASLKMDGLSVRLTYEGGDLVCGETRGDGQEGSDVTEHVRVFSNVPLSIPYKDTFVIDGEAIITYDDFDSIKGDYKNPRNLAAGTLNSLDTRDVKDRKLRFVAWDVIVGCTGEFFLERLDMAEKFGFTVVPHEIVADNDYDEVNSRLKSEAETLSYPIDGVVWRINDIAFGEERGSTSHHFLNAVAYKFEDLCEETRLLDIEWTMGKTGVLTPTAVFEPVELEGTTVERASLHNITVMRELSGGVECIGDMVSVYKANAIIPQINNWKHNKGIILHIPETCPLCGGKTEIVESNNTKNLACTNTNCRGKLLGKLSAFVSKDGMDIDGLSEKTLETFIDFGWLNKFSDIFSLDKYKIKMYNTEGFGRKSVDNLLKSIEKSKTVKLNKFINSLQIPMVGRSQSKELANRFKTWDFFYTKVRNKYDFSSIPGFGKVLNTNIHEWFDANLEEVERLTEIVNFEEATDDKVSDVFAGKTFVVTGDFVKFKPRKKLEEEVVKRGGKVSGSVSKKTSFVVCNNANSGSSKMNKAKELDIPIINEEEFLAMI